MILSEYYGLTPGIYVGPSGDDTNDGLTPATALATTSGTGGAIDKSSAGDVVGMLNGTYTYAVGDFDMGADRKFVGQSFLGVVIDASGYSGNPTNFLEFGSVGVDVPIINIRVTGISTPNSSDNNAVFYINSGIAGLVTFENCVFNDIGLRSNLNRGALFGLNGVTTYGPLRMKLNNSILYDIYRLDTFSNAIFFRGRTDGNGATYYYELNNTSLILSATGLNSITYLFSNTTAADADMDIVATNNIFLDLSGTTTDFYRGFNVDTNNNIYNGFDSLPTLGANDSTDDPKLIDPTFINLTDPDDIKLAFEPQRISGAIGKGVAT